MQMAKRPQCDTPLVKFFGDFRESLTPQMHKGSSEKKNPKKNKKIQNIANSFEGTLD
jgi:hypothetical protein